jgi:hypothetical protein
LPDNANLNTITMNAMPLKRWLVFALAALGAWQHSRCCLNAQEKAAAEPTKADDSAKVGYTVIPAGPGGLYVYAPERWGMINIDVVNPHDEPRNIFCATYFEMEPTLQYGRRVWMPAKSRLRTWHPIYIPNWPQSRGRLIPFRSIVDDAGVVLRDDTGQVQHAGNLQLMYNLPISGYIADVGTGDTNFEFPPYDLLVASRVFEGRTRQSAQLLDEFLPAEEESYDALDQLLIATRRVADDAAGLAAIRQWVAKGGKLWVMLDLADARLMEHLLGDAWECHVVDKVALNSVAIEPTHPSRRATPAEETEAPIDMVRVVPSGVDVWFTVNGWPAAFWQDFGKGRVLVTTLGAKAWLRKGDPKTGFEAMFDQRQVAGRPNFQMPTMRISELEQNLHYTSYYPVPSMRDLAAEFYAPLVMDAVIEEPILEKQANDYIGYSIPSRGLVLGLLAGFALAISGAAFVLRQLERLELMGLATTVLAVTASVVLIAAANSTRKSIAPSFTAIQRVQPVPGTNDFTSRGIAALYTPDGTEAILGTKFGGRVVPDMSGQEGTTRRMIWTDMNDWHWENLTLPTGTRVARFTRSGTAREPLLAEATFGEAGLAGKVYAGGATGLSDAVILTSQGRLGATLRPDGTFEASSDAVLARDQYVFADYLSDEQKRRQQTMRELLSRKEGGAPELFLWSSPWTDGIVLDPARAANGAALISMPLALHRPPAGTTLTVPGPLLPFGNASGPDGSQSSSLWDYKNHVGAPRSQPGSAWMRFQPPAALLPLEALGVKLRIQVTGPIGKVSVGGWKSGQVVTLAERVDPVGTIEFQIRDAEVLKLDAQGGFLLRISGGDPARPELTQAKEQGGVPINWSLLGINVTLEARTLESAVEASN